MFQRNYKMLELQGVLKFGTIPSRFTNQDTLRLNILVIIPTMPVMLSMDIWPLPFPIEKLH